MLERKNLGKYYTFTKIAYFIWFILSALVIASMFKDVFVGHIDARNIVFQIFFSIILLIVGYAFRYLNFLLKDILQGDTFFFYTCTKFTPSSRRPWPLSSYMAV